jgi:branched-chain amino acid aminotransferase
MGELNIKINKIKSSRLKDVDFESIQFGRVFSDHMFVADYADGKWENFEILPFQDLNYNPAFNSLHYGQSVFEGMKAHLDSDENVILFRPMDNFKRLNKSCERLCMATIDPEIMLEGLSELVKIDRNWIPKNKGWCFVYPTFYFCNRPIHRCCSFRNI